MPPYCTCTHSLLPITRTYVATTTTSKPNPFLGAHIPSSTGFSKTCTSLVISPFLCVYRSLQSVLHNTVLEWQKGKENTTHLLRLWLSNTPITLVFSLKLPAQLSFSKSNLYFLPTHLQFPFPVHTKSILSATRSITSNDDSAIIIVADFKNGNRFSSWNSALNMCTNPEVFRLVKKREYGKKPQWPQLWPWTSQPQ